MDKLIDELLELHCKKCDGISFGCNGCEERRLIEEVLKRHGRTIVSFEK